MMDIVLPNISHLNTPIQAIASLIKHIPHLTPKEIDPMNDGVLQPIEGEGVRSARIVGCVGLLANPLIPIVTVAIKSSRPMAIDAHVVAAEDEGRRLVLVTDVQRIREPVRDVRTPLRVATGLLSAAVRDTEKLSCMALLGTSFTLQKLRRPEVIDCGALLCDLPEECLGGQFRHHPTR